jgi:hypothetical protein
MVGLRYNFALLRRIRFKFSPVLPRRAGLRYRPEEPVQSGMIRFMYSIGICCLQYVEGLIGSSYSPVISKRFGVRLVPGIILRR